MVYVGGRKVEVVVLSSDEEMEDDDDDIQCSPVMFHSVGD